MILAAECLLYDQQFLLIVTVACLSSISPLQMTIFNQTTNYKQSKSFALIENEKRNVKKKCLRGFTRQDESKLKNSSFDSQKLHWIMLTKPEDDGVCVAASGMVLDVFFKDMLARKLQKVT